MIFGRSLFGGALVAGYVTLTGAAACTATATAEAQVNFNGAGAAEVVAEASAQALRFAHAVGHPAHAAAMVLAGAKVDFFLESSGTAGATAQGGLTAHFSGYGDADAGAQGNAALYRRIRMSFQPPARCYAEGEGEAQSYLLLYGQTAHGRATAFGTTYQVAGGSAYAYAELSGDAQKMFGVKQNAHGTATAEAKVGYTAGALVNANAYATGWADAAVTINGVRTFELFGKAVGSADAVLSHVAIFQPQIMTGRAALSVLMVHTRGLKGSGTGRAFAIADAVVIQTGIQGSPAQVSAAATAQAVRVVHGAGHAVALAELRVNPQTAFNAQSSAEATAKADASTVHLLMAEQPTAQVTAHVHVSALRNAVGSGEASANATGFGYNQINDLVHAPTSRTVLVLSTARLAVIAAEPRTIYV